MSDTPPASQKPAAGSNRQPAGDSTRNRGGAHAKLPISVHILTFNSAATVEKALRSVQECREILVVDGGSSDGTLEIAGRYGARTVWQRPEREQGKHIADFSAVRNTALRAATQPWILALDSDEYLSPALQEALREAVGGEPAAYYIQRKYVLPRGAVVDYATTYPNERLYFFHRDTVEEWTKPVHERPKLKRGAVTRRLRGASLAPIGSLEAYREKNMRYLRIEARKSAGKGWAHWLRHRVYHTLRSRLVALIKLLWIWLIPRRGTRLPLQHELMRFWYGWKLIVATCPPRANNTSSR